MSRLQPRFGDLEKFLRIEPYSAPNSKYLTPKHWQANLCEGKGINFMIWAMSKVARRCHQLGLRPPKETITKGNLLRKGF